MAIESINSLEEASYALKELEQNQNRQSQRIRQLEQLNESQKKEITRLMKEAGRTIDWAKHVYRVDHYGYIWVYNVDKKDYRKTEMRVCTSRLADESVTTDKIADGAVTRSKIAPGAITGDKIAPGTLDGLDVALRSNFVYIDVARESGDIVVFFGEEGRHNDIEICEDSGDVMFIVNDKVVDKGHEEGCSRRDVFFGKGCGIVALDASRYKMAVITCLGDITDVKLASMPALGEDFCAVFRSDAERTVCVKGNMVFPDGEFFEATVLANGYVEVHFMYDGNKVYLRGA